MDRFDLSRRLAAEALGTGILVATVVGSGIMAETLTKDVALALLCNTLPTGAILVVLITVLGPISGAHFNPAVTLVFTGKRELPVNEAALYIMAQIAGGAIGTMAAHLMFAHPLIDFSMKVRTGGAQWFAEAVAASASSLRSWPASAFSDRPSPGWSASTSPPPTGSRPRRRSPTRRSRSHAR
jgi:glycerol uptake facilitator-like aquaporin